MTDSDNADLLYDPGDEEETQAHVEARVKRTPLPTPSTRYLLLSIAGEDLGRVVPIDDARLVVGRGAECHVVLKDNEASRQHARILRVGSMTTLEDLASLNGTFVNGKRVVRHALSNGDIVRFGIKSLFRFTVTDSTEEAVLRQLYESSVLNPLTGAHRRADVELRLAEEVSIVRRQSVSVSVLMLSIDNLAKLREMHGQHVAAQILALISAAISSELRADDLFGHCSSDRFALILRKTALQAARALAERIQRVVAAIEIDHEDGPIRLSVSVGGASHICCDPLTAPKLLDLAEVRLTEATKSGNGGLFLGSGS